MGELDSALIQLVKTRYEEIVKINLTTKTREVVWPSVSTKDFFRRENFYHKDIKSFRKFRNSEVMKCALANKDSLSFRVRRKLSNKQYEWIQIEVVKSSQYSDSNVEIFVFIKNIDEVYGKEYKARRNAEKLAKTDSLTGYFNRFAFDKFKTSYTYSSVGVAYIDLNQLKLVNDTKGHTAGDDYIKACCQTINKSFVRSNKYRIGGDEFVIVVPDVSLSKFKLCVKHFTEAVNDSLVKEDMPICSVGYRWTNSDTVPMEEIVRSAETAMYAQKEAAYLKYHVDRRSHSDRRSGVDRRAKFIQNNT